MLIWEIEPDPVGPVLETIGDVSIHEGGLWMLPQDWSGMSDEQVRQVYDRTFQGPFDGGHGHRVFAEMREVLVDEMADRGMLQGEVA